MLYLARRATMCISIHTHTYAKMRQTSTPLAVFQPEFPLPLKLSDSIPPPDIIRSRRYSRSTYIRHHTSRAYADWHSLRCAPLVYIHMWCVWRGTPFCSCVAIDGGLTSRGNFTSRGWISTLLSYIFHDSDRTPVTMLRYLCEPSMTQT